MIFLPVLHLSLTYMYTMYIQYIYNIYIQYIYTIYIYNIYIQYIQYVYKVNVELVSSLRRVTSQSVEKKKLVEEEVVQGMNSWILNQFLLRKWSGKDYEMRTRLDHFKNWRKRGWKGKRLFLRERERERERVARKLIVTRCGWCC